MSIDEEIYDILSGIGLPLYSGDVAKKDAILKATGRYYYERFKKELGRTDTAVIVLRLDQLEQILEAAKKATTTTNKQIVGEDEKSR